MHSTIPAHLSRRPEDASEQAARRLAQRRATSEPTSEPTRRAKKARRPEDASEQAARRLAQRRAEARKLDTDECTYGPDTAGEYNMPTIPATRHPRRIARPLAALQGLATVALYVACDELHVERQRAVAALQAGGWSWLRATRAMACEETLAADSTVVMILDGALVARGES